MYGLLKPILFKLDAEKAHELTLGLLKGFQRRPFLLNILSTLYKSERWNQPITLAGLCFPNRVGLAAGLDKNALLPDVWAALGFGFAEFGTVTPLPQPGNNKPRLFRLPADEALLNRMGFNNRGAEVAAERLHHRIRRTMIVGGNIGKNKDTPSARAPEDYARCVRMMYDAVDYFTINVSSPNTPGLRHLQDSQALRNILLAVAEAQQKIGNPKPVFVKIAPDLSDAAVEELTSLALEMKVAGIVATNTTIRRDGLRTPAWRVEKLGNGGISGAPLRERSTEVVRLIRHTAGPHLVIIASGGILSPRDALEKRKAGADLIQLYTGLIYHGPSLIRAIKKALAANA
jgi:dihydroorotate dehydrogenase